MTDNAKTIVDPPSGWMYGFPKEFDFKSSGNPETYEDELKQWFLDNGYPKELIENGRLKYCRYWVAND